MKMREIAMVAFTVIVATISCKEKTAYVKKPVPEKKESLKPILAQGEIKESTPTTNKMLVTSDSFYGVTKGASVDQLDEAMGKQFSPVTIQNAEGSFDIYQITDEEDNLLAHVHKTEAGAVDFIEIRSKDAITEDGIKIGNTVGDLRAISPDLNIQVSEIESRVHATLNGITYRLDVLSGSPGIDPKTIGNEVEITLILTSF